MASGDIFAATDGGVFRSTDGGASWQMTSLQAPTSRLLQRGGDRLLAVTGVFARDTVYASLDAGDSWTSLGQDSTLRTLYALLPRAEGTLLAGFLSWRMGVWQSSDDGRTWTHLALDLFVEDLEEGPDGTLYAATSVGLLASRDDGRTWEEQGYTAHPSDVAVLPDGRLYLRDHIEGVIYRRDDAGAWHPVPSPVSEDVPTSQVRSLTRTPDGHLLAGTVQSVFRLEADGEWTRADEGLLGHSFTSFEAGPDGSLYAGGWATGLYATRDQGATWSVVRVGQGAPFAVSPEGHLFVAHGDSLVRSVDGGATWVGVDSPVQSGPVYAVFVDPAGVLYVAGFPGVFRSEDDGATWTQTNLETGSFGHPSSPLYTGDGDLILLGGFYGMHRTDDGGATWTHYPNLQMPHAISESPNGTFFAGNQSGLFRSADRGATWMPTSLQGFTSGAPLADGAGRLYAPTERGVFRSEDDGATWYSLSAGLGQNGVTALGMDEEGFLYASTTHGVYRSTVPLGTDVETPVPQASPPGGTVSGFPNPFGSTTTFSVMLERPALVSLIVYNARGARVASIVEGWLPAGTHTYRWDAGALPNGLYLCRMTTSGRSQTFRVIKAR